MKRKTIAVLLIISMLCMTTCISCGQTEVSRSVTAESSAQEKTAGAAEPVLFENLVSPCEITGYKTYQGRYKSMFLSKGDRIAVIAPSAIPSQEQVDATIEGLKKWGYEPVEGKHVREQKRSLQDCYEDLKWALKDETIKAIFCVRGGYAASEVMDITSADLIKKAKKLIIGYSDITIYHSAWSTVGLPSVHASMSAAFTDLPKACADAQEQMLKGEIPTYKCQGNQYCKKGTAKGVLIGGNLTTVISTVNTAYDCTQTDQPYILFIEAVEESMQRLHRYLTILKHMGVLDKAQGIVIGELTDVPADMAACDYDGTSRGGEFASAEDMICRQFLEEYDIPVAFGFPAGHGEMNYPLLLGEEASLNVTEDGCTLEWMPE